MMLYKYYLSWKRIIWIRSGKTNTTYIVYLNFNIWYLFLMMFFLIFSTVMLKIFAKWFSNLLVHKVSGYQYGKCGSKKYHIGLMSPQINVSIYVCISAITLHLSFFLFSLLWLHNWNKGVVIIIITITYQKSHDVVMHFQRQSLLMYNKQNKCWQCYDSLNLI